MIGATIRLMIRLNKTTVISTTRSAKDSKPCCSLINKLAMASLMVSGTSTRRIRCNTPWASSSHRMACCGKIIKICSISSRTAGKSQAMTIPIRTASNR